MPIYTFNLTATDSRIHTKSIDLEDSMTINDLKIHLVGPIINSLGYDKIKFFQTGKQFSEDDVVGDFNEHERVLIFPMIPSLRMILVKSFCDDKDDSDDEKEASGEEEGKEESDEEDEAASGGGKVEEEPPKMEPRETEEILKLNNETLAMFKQEDMMKLMEIYSRNQSVFIEFIDYMAQGHFKEFDQEAEITYPSEMLKDIKDTFKIFSELTDEELVSKLDNVGGNLDLLISTSMANEED